MALQILAGLWKATKELGPVEVDSYLLDNIQEVFGPLWSKRLCQSGEDTFLHNGAFPCYNLYRTVDGFYLAVACIEEKFWRESSV